MNIKLQYVGERDDNYIYYIFYSFFLNNQFVPYVGESLCDHLQIMKLF